MSTRQSVGHHRDASFQLGRLDELSAARCAQRFDLFHGKLQPLIAVIDIAEILDPTTHVGPRREVGNIDWDFERRLFR